MPLSPSNTVYSTPKKIFNQSHLFETPIKQYIESLNFYERSVITIAYMNRSFFFEDRSSYCYPPFLCDIIWDHSLLFSYQLWMILNSLKFSKLHQSENMEPNNALQWFDTTWVPFELKVLTSQIVLTSVSFLFPLPSLLTNSNQNFFIYNEYW